MAEDDLALVAFDDAVDGFDLPALSIVVARANGLIHQLPIVTGGRLIAWSTGGGRDGGELAVVGASQLMIRFAVIAGIEQ